RRLVSNSPAIFNMVSVPLIRKKNPLASFATARTMRVFPVPGGQNLRRPRGGLIPMDPKS
ncbi:cell division control protein 48, partial [Lentinus brumalis]